MAISAPMDNKIKLNPDMRVPGDPELGELAPIKTRFNFELEVKTSSISPLVGMGAFTNEFIKKGSIICIGGGQVFSTLTHVPTDRDFLGIYDETHFIGPLDYEEIPANWYINHSCDSNVKLIGRLVLIARRDIKAGEELTLNYSAVGAGSAPWSIDCKCGSNSCRSRVSNEDWKDKQLFDQYYEEWPEFIQKSIEGGR
jgi:uncharacterized protein